MPKRNIDDVDSYFLIDKAKNEEKKEEEKLSVSDVKGENEYDDLEMMVFGGEDGFEEGLDDFIHAHKKDCKVKAFSNEKKAKWEDDDDDEASLQKHSQITENPAWATKEIEKKEKEDDEDSDSEDGEGLEWETGNYISKTSRLSAHSIKYSFCPNINLGHAADRKVKVLEMMSRDQIALVGGNTLKLFKVGGKKCLNNEVKPLTIALEKFPVSRAKFVANECQILIGSVYPTFVTYDMTASKVIKHSIKDLEYTWNSKVFEVSPDDKMVAVVAKSGAVNILNCQTKGWMHTLKGEAEVTEALCFSADSSKLYVHADGGVVHIWCLRTNKCMARFQDQGCYRGSSIESSPCGNFLATGCNSGIVNLYDARKLERCIHSTKRFELAAPEPLKSVHNLVSACTSLRFHPSSELLAMASNYSQDSLKLLHINSLSVFSNFPEPMRKLGLVHSVAFSPLGGGYMSFGNHKGKAHLIRLKHFSSY